MKKIIQTDLAPQAIGTYSQAIQVENTIYLSGQIALDPKTMVLVEGIEAQINQVLNNMKAVCEAAAGSLSDLVKLNVYLIDLAHFALVNEAMARFFQAPYPARAAVQVSALPRGALVEMDAVMVLPKKV